MYFLYVDGSGQTKIKRSLKDNGFYILSGVCVHEKNWKTLESNLTSLKEELLPQLDPTKWELHAADIWNNRGFFKKPELHINFEKKKEIFLKVCKLVCESDVILFNVIILKDKLKDKYSTPKPKEYSWTLIVERFEHLLRQEPEETNNGLLFVDSDQRTPEQQIKNIIWRLVRQGSLWQQVDHVIEDPIFTKSHLRNIIQLSDLIAYIVHKHYREDLQFEAWFKLLKVKMYQPDGKLSTFGLVEFP